MVAIYKILHNILFVAGFLSILVLAMVIGQFGRKDIELTIFAVAASLYLALMIVQSMVNRRNKRIRLMQETSAAAAGLQGKFHSLQASSSYHHDAQTVWSLIRPAESATFLSDAQRAFTVPGTPQGVGEQQCFIGRDGSASIIEVIGEEGPWWATTRPLAQDGNNRRTTYRLEPTATGCTLTVGAVIELPANSASPPTLTSGGKAISGRIWTELGKSFQPAKIDLTIICPGKSTSSGTQAGCRRRELS